MTRNTGLPPFTDPEAVNAYCFPTFEKHMRNGGALPPEMRDDFPWETYETWFWDSRSWCDKTYPYLPSNIHRLGLPLDPKFHQSPHNLAHWLFTQNIGLNDEDLRWVLPLMKMELETIIFEWDEVENDRLRYEGIVGDIRRFLLTLTYYFAQKSEIRDCIDDINFWCDWYIGALGCFDEHERLDREQAMLNLMNYKLGDVQ